MRRALAILMLTSIALMGSTQGAIGDAGYSDIGFDPNDAASRFVDIRNTTRTIERDAKGRHWLSVTLTAWEHLPQTWNMRVKLDTRGGRRWDSYIAFNNFDGPPYCGLLLRHGGGWDAPTHHRGDHAKCRFRLRKFGEIDKRVRWQVVVIGSSEHAPNVGWYE